MPVELRQGLGAVECGIARETSLRASCACGPIFLAPIMVSSKYLGRDYNNGNPHTGARRLLNDSANSLRRPVESKSQFWLMPA
jgi:hypothetical protein